MPAERLEAVFARADEPLLGGVEQVARTFHVTPLAAAARIARAELAPRAAIDRVIAEMRERGEGAQPKRTGGDYYVNRIAGLGPGYVRLVFAALDNQAVTYPTAATLLGGVKVSNFDKLRAQLARRTELE